MLPRGLASQSGPLNEGGGKDTQAIKLLSRDPTNLEGLEFKLLLIEVGEVCSVSLAGIHKLSWLGIFSDKSG